MLLLLFATTPLLGQLKYKLTGEGGIAQAATSVNNAQHFLLAGFEGQLKLAHSTRKYAWRLQTELQPEFFFQTVNITALVWNVKGQYFRKHRKFSWGIKTDYRLNRLMVDVLDLNYNVFLGGIQSAWFYRPGASIALNLEYAYRDVDASIENTLKAFLFSAKWLRLFTLSTKISAGIYGENFFIDGVAAEGSNLRENNGWRFGPELTLDYKRKFVLNATYRLISHQSQILDEATFEHWIRLLFGKILSPKWSLFFLTDFYLRDNTVQADTNPNLLYSPLSNQNRFYVKLDQELTRKTDVFLKIGYTSENLVYEELTFSGWRGTVGVEIRN